MVLVQQWDLNPWSMNKAQAWTAIAHLTKGSVALEPQLLPHESRFSCGGCVRQHHCAVLPPGQLILQPPRSRCQL